MAQVLHGSATAMVLRAIQHSQESLRALAKRYGINQKSVPMEAPHLGSRSSDRAKAGEIHGWAHAIEYACARQAIDHWLTKPKHPWTNG